MTEDLKKLIERLKKNPHHNRIIAEGYARLSADEKLIFDQKLKEQMLSNAADFRKLINKD